MSVPGLTDTSDGKATRVRLLLAATVIGIGISGGFGQPAAWADTGGSESGRSPSTSRSESDNRPQKASPRHDVHQQQRSTGNGTRTPQTDPDKTTNPASAGRNRRTEITVDTTNDRTGTQRIIPLGGETAAVGVSTGAPPAPESVPPTDTTLDTPMYNTSTDTTPSAAQPDSISTPQGSADIPSWTPHATKGAAHIGSPGATTPDTSAEHPSSSTMSPPPRTPTTGRPLAATVPATLPVRATAVGVGVTAKVAAVTTTPTTGVTAPTAPGPLSPIAKIIALPGRIVNTVLQALGFTTSANGPHSPFNFAPIDQLLFAVFRTVQDVLGLSKTPSVQLVPPTMTYDGPTTAPTPTVAQFLNAATAEYGLGTTPGGLQPFTVNGFQMTSTNILSGHSATVWVTPQQQIIIAYQGTTGGTNLLFNPLIVISQLITDLQIILTGTTPWAFYDALAFEQRVQAEAARQGYDTRDIFVTGHSLGGWQAAYVAQQTGLGGIGFESPGLNTTVPGNGADSGFVNIATYGDPAAYTATDLPGLQPFMPAYVPGGGSKPHYGAIVMIGDPGAVTPLINSSAQFARSLLGTLIFAGDFLGNFFGHHLPGMQAYNLDVNPDPGVVPWLGMPMGPVDTGWGNLTIPQLKLAASTAGRLVLP